jgi:hypothetical protein
LRIKNQKDFFSGLMFMGIGAAFSGGALAYRIGAASSMGPGYFALWLGVLLALLGALITFKSLALESIDGGKIGSFAWRPLFFIIGANLAFGLLLGGLPSIGLPPAGLIAAIYALTFIASMAQTGWRFKPTLALATVLAVGSYLVFVLTLKLQLTLWPTFITG